MLGEKVDIFQYSKQKHQQSIIVIITAHRHDHKHFLAVIRTEYISYISPPSESYFSHPKKCNKHFELLIFCAAARIS